MKVHFDVVIPTVGRASLLDTLDAVGSSSGPRPAAVIVADDRRSRDSALSLPARGWPAEVPLRVVRTRGGQGPAAARNAGARAGTADWIAFVDDDVVPGPDWLETLTEDLVAQPQSVAASLGDVSVPAPSGRRPTDAERNVLALACAPWISADLAFRRSALAALGGFDERFRRAYREDTDLLLRTRRAGCGIVSGKRRSVHRLRGGGFWASLHAQAGNADDALLDSIHGRDWRALSGERRSRMPIHALKVALGALAAGLPAFGARRAGRVAAGVYSAMTLHFFLRRALPGPRTPHELASMAATSVLIPPAALLWYAIGWQRARRSMPQAPRPWAQSPQPGSPPRRIRAVFFDRDGTLIDDVPANADPSQVRPVPGALAALERLRSAGIQVAIVTNQGPLAGGRPTPSDVERIQERVAELLGAFDGVYACLHSPGAGCACRKPAPGLLERAMRELGCEPDECAFVGDTGADIAAGRAAGVRAILVPNAVTLSVEVEEAPEVAPDLEAAVKRLLGTP